MKRPFEIYILSLLLLFLAFGAIYGGGSLIISPNGALLGMQSDWLDKSPFTSYLIPGFLLLLFNGIFPLLAIYGLIIRNQTWFGWLNVYSNKYWGWTFSVYSGIITNIWIIVQQLMAEYFILQTIIAAVGLLIIIFTLMPRVQKYYTF